MSRFETILYSVDGGIAIITLNRPDKLNAFSIRMKNEMCSAFDLADADDDVRAVVVTGAGDAYCAGADLSAGAATFDYSETSEWQQGGSFIRDDGSIDYDHPSAQDSGGQLTMRIFRCLKPVIAASNGAAVGIGATMQLAMDARVAATSARYGFVFSRRGVIAEAASSWFLPRLVGIDTALDWCLSGRLVAAEEALSKGLVRSVHAREDVLPAAIELAHMLTAQGAPVSIALIRQMLWRMLGAGSPIDAHRLDSRLMVDRGRASDAREGVASFLERRPALFTDRVSTDMPASYPWWPDERG